MQLLVEGRGGAEQRGAEGKEQGKSNLVRALERYTDELKRERDDHLKEI